MGSNVAGLGDLNGDGVGDYAICATGYDSGGASNVGLLRVISGADASVIHEYIGTVSGGNIGTCVTSVGDVDGDAVPDFAFGSDEGYGHLYLASGATGVFLWTLAGGTSNGDFGESIAALGDVNGDLIPDFAVGDGAYDTTTITGYITDSGAVWVFDGSNGSIIALLWGTIPYDRMGESLAPLGDVNADGITDFLCGSNGYSSPTLSECGLTAVHSGANAAQLFTVTGATSYIYSPSALAGVGDINGDGFADFLVGAQLEEPSGGLDQGSVTLHSGRPADNGLILNKWFGTENLEHLGCAVSSAGDVDEDGVDDFLFGANGSAFGGRAYIYSGGNGERLWISESEGWAHRYGSSVAGIGDINNDGSLEILIGSTRAWNMGPSPGAAYLLSFQNFASVSATSLSAAAGGTVTWSLNFPDDYVHQSNHLRYRTLLSTTAGLSHAYGWQIPLGADSLFASSSSGFYPGVFTNPEGALNTDGDASVSAVLPAGFASRLVGSTFYVSFACYELTDWNALLVHGFSRTLPLTITP